MGTGISTGKDKGEGKTPLLQNEYFRLYRLRGYISTLYLADYGDRLLLLDCGCACDIGNIVELVEGIGRRPGDIKLAVVTHMHPDHAGGACGLRRRFAIPLAAHVDADRWYRGLAGMIQHLMDSYMAQLVAIATGRRLHSVSYRRRVKADHILRDGDTLPGFPDWTVVHVPGHTTHDIALYHKGSGILYCSDCIIHLGGRLVLPIPVFFHDEMKRSIGKLSRLEPDVIIPAHGDPIEFNRRPDVFSEMIGIVDRPHNRVQRRFHRISVFAPDVRRFRKKRRLKMPVPPR